METIRIEGMGCGKCTAAVKNALAQVPDIEVVEVDTGFAKIQVTAGTKGLETAIEAIEDAGYDVVR